MSLSLNKQVVISSSIILIWVIYTFAAFVYFTNQKLVAFDETGLLKGVTGTQFTEKLQIYSHNTNSLDDLSSTTVFHFIDPSCKCQTTSTQHINDIDEIARNNGFNIKIVDVTKQGNLPIPSVPSIAILGSSSEFVYFGPYGEGLACSETAGYAQTMLNNYLKGFNGQLMATEAKGCYCKV